MKTPSMKKIVPALFTLAVLTLTLASQATAGLVTAIDNTSQQPNNGLYFQAPYLQGLVFQTGTNPATITNLTIGFFSSAAPCTGTFGAYLYSVAGATNMPDAALSSKDTLSYSLASGYSNVLYTGTTISNVSNILLAANTKYALVLGEQAGDVMFWSTKAPGSYDTKDGYSVVKGAVQKDGANAWTTIGADHIIKLDVTTVPVPEPSSCILFGIGAIGMRLGLRRQKTA
jgi:hypothetical protein